MIDLLLVICCLILSCWFVGSGHAVEWVRAGINAEQPRWGIKDARSKYEII